MLALILKIVAIFVLLYKKFPFSAIIGKKRKKRSINK